MMHSHDGYTLVDGGSLEALKKGPRPMRQRRVRRAIALAVLVVALCVGYAAFSWETRVRACHAEDFDQSLLTGDASVHHDNVRTFELKTWPARIEDGGDVVVSWASRTDCVTQREDFLTLSCGPTLGDHEYLQRKNVTETDATPHSVRFSDAMLFTV